MRAKVKTALLVILLSCLIWVFAERSVTKEARVDIKIELPSQPDNLLVEYLDDQGNALPEPRMTVRLTVKGPTRRVLAVNETYLKSITLDATKIGIELKEVNSRKSWVPVMTILEGRLYSREGENYLQITDTEPTSLHLRVTKLIEKSLPVKVYDRDGAELTPESIEPGTVPGFVWEGRPAEAKITLDDGQLLKAMQEECEFKAQVILANRVKDYPVKLKLSRYADLKSDTIRGPRIFISKPLSMEGKYKVVIEDESELEDYNLIKCSGAPEAVRNYLDSDVHLILKIYESDIPSLQGFRPLIYNLPVGYGQIEIEKKTQMPIKFRLEELNVK